MKLKINVNRKYKYYFLCVFLIIIHYWYHLAYIPIDSDMTTMIPMCLDSIQHGNWLLKGWVFGTNNFYFTDMIWEIILLKLGVSYQAIIYGLGSLWYSILLVLLIYYCNECIFNNYTKSLVISILIIVVLPLMANAITFLNLHHHTSAYVYCVLCWVLYINYLKYNKISYLVFYTIIATLGSFSDGMFQMLLFAPICTTILIELAKKKNVRQNVIVLFFTIFSYGISSLFLYLANRSVFVFHTLGIPVYITPVNIWGQRFIGYTKALLDLYGQQPFGITIYGLYESILCLYVLLTLVAFFYYGIKLFNNSIPINIIWFACVFNLGGCIITGVDITNRYIGPYYVFSMFLLFILISDFYQKVCSEFNNRRIIAKVAIIIVSLLVCLVKGNIILSLPNALYNESDEKKVADYLFSKNVMGGYGEYWSASRIYYETGYKIPIYQISLHKGNHKIQPFSFLCKDSWYSEQHKNFIINSPSAEHLNDSDILAICGDPIEYKIIGKYEIFIFDHDISLYLQLFGWGDQEPWGQWGSGNKQDIKIAIDKDNTEVTLYLQSFAIPTIVDIYADDILIDTVQVQSGEPQPYTFLLHKGNHDYVTISLVNNGELKSPKELGISEDTRKLGIGLSKVLLNGEPIP